MRVKDWSGVGHCGRSWRRKSDSMMTWIYVGLEMTARTLSNYHLCICLWYHSLPKCMVFWNEFEWGLPQKKGKALIFILMSELSRRLAFTGPSPDFWCRWKYKSYHGSVVLIFKLWVFREYLCQQGDGQHLLVKVRSLAA